MLSMFTRTQKQQSRSLHVRKSQGLSEKIAGLMFVTVTCLEGKSTLSGCGVFLVGEIEAQFCRNGRLPRLSNCDI